MEALNKKPFLSLAGFSLLVFGLNSVPSQITLPYLTAFANNKTTYSIQQQKSGIQLEGLVTIDNQPSAARIEILSTSKHHNKAVVLNADSISGMFFAVLEGGDSYDISIKVKKFPQQVLGVSTIGIDSSMVLPIFADFISAAYDKKIEDLIRSTEHPSKKTLAFNEKDFFKRYGAYKKEGLSYKVQIAAYRFFENFNYNNVLGLPKIIRKTETDYITRFTMGEFLTYNEAVLLMQKAKQHKLSEAFVVAYYMGNRKLLKEVYSEKIIP